MCRSPCYHDIGCAGVIFQMWQAFRVIVTEESAGFSVTMAVLALEALFLGIDTEKMAYFCGTIRDAQQNYVFDIPICNYYSLSNNSSASVFSINVNPNHFFPRSLIAAPTR